MSSTLTTGFDSRPKEDEGGGSPTPWPASHRQRLEDSRRFLLDSVGAAPEDEVTFVRSVGNLGDELIFAGTRRLLAELPCREIGLDELDSASGATAVLAGGGAWCLPYHELMPRALEQLEARFERVIVFPSSFDVSVPAVERALSRTRAIVFAREPTSFEQIGRLCEARLALDGAFFFDFSSHRCRAGGTLNAFRTDRESASRFPLPADNRDISIACQSLDDWLWTIARHARVRTDRAHVMIAGALLGRIVEYRPSAYHKLPALAEWALADFPVRLLPEDRPPRLFRPSPDHGAPIETFPSESIVASVRDRIRNAARTHGPETEDLPGRAEPRATIVLSTRDRSERVLNAARSIRQSTRRPYRILILGSGAAPSICDELENATARDLETDFLSLETPFERSGSRQFALDLVTTEYVFYLDEDAEVFPGTIDRLVADLDNHPEALAVGARVVSEDGGLECCGGKLTEGGGVARFEQPDAGRPPEDMLESGPCDWVSGTAFLARRDAFTLHPFDTEMTFNEDQEWCYRVSRRGGPSPFRRCSDAFVLRRDWPDALSSSESEEGTRVLARVRSIARFYQVHGRVLDAIFEVVPELTSGKIEGDFEAATDFLHLVLAKGPERVLDQRSRGELSLLFAGDLAIPRRAEEHELHRIRTSRFWRAANLYWSARRRFSRLARLPRPR